MDLFSACLWEQLWPLFLRTPRLCRRVIALSWKSILSIGKPILQTWTTCVAAPQMHPSPTVSVTLLPLSKFHFSHYYKSPQCYDYTVLGSVSNKKTFQDLLEPSTPTAGLFSCHVFFFFRHGYVFKWGNEEEETRQFVTLNTTKQKPKQDMVG